MTTSIETNNKPQQDMNSYQDKITSMTEKTEHQPHNISLITPPMSPINTASVNRGSLKITAGQTGLPWLTRDANAGSPTTTTTTTTTTAAAAAAAAVAQHSPKEISVSSPTTNDNNSSCPPPKFMARPRTASGIRFPTRRRTLQKHIYTMKDGLDPVKVLCNRLLSWQISVKYLLNMFHSIKKVESKTGKGYRKIDSKSTIPVKMKDQFKSSHGVHDALSAFRQYTRENSLIHQDFVDFIVNDIVPVLHTIIKDIHAMMHSLKQNKDLRTGALWECRKKADKVITQLNSDIYSAVNSQERAKNDHVLPKSRDPLLSKYVVIQAIRDLYKQENRLHKGFLKIQDEYRKFEQEKIIRVYTELFQTFERYRVQHHLENLESVVKVARILDAIETDAEWLDFVQHNDNELVRPNAAFKDEETLDFPNASHPLVQPLAIGVLQRHHGKKWHEEFYVLSPIGLLHRFKSEKGLLNAPLQPEATMFVPQCTILINHTSQLLELRGKYLGSLFGSKKLLELSSSDYDFIKQWIGIMGPMAAQQETAVIDTPLPPPLAVQNDNRSIHSKVQTEGSSNLGGGGVTENGSAAAAAANDTNIQGNTADNFQPISNIPVSDLQFNNSCHDQDSDHDFARQTIEYSTHSPVAEPQTIALQSISTNTASSFDPATVITGPPTPTMTPVQQKQDVHTPLAFDSKKAKMPGGCPTRQDSDIFWDSAA